ncbi:hypothetical protein RV18_GL001214 [Enterococcus termitis]|nr:hypothetical protein RV18_GL001214 [Enterococcus termitis]
MSNINSSLAPITGLYKKSPLAMNAKGRKIRGSTFFHYRLTTITS